MYNLLPKQEMIEDIITEAVRKRQQGQEEIIKQAFLHHFHFPIDKVLHEGNFSREIMLNSTVQRFCYKGEGFLLYDEDNEFKVESGEDTWTAVMTSKYRMI